MTTQSQAIDKTRMSADTPSSLSAEEAAEALWEALWPISGDPHAIIAQAFRDFADAQIRALKGEADARHLQAADISQDRG